MSVRSILSGRQRDELWGARRAATQAFLHIGGQNLATSEMVCVAAGRRERPWSAERVRAERAAHADILRCVFRSTLAAVAFDPEWRSSSAVHLAARMYDGRDFALMPILADALQDAGCDSAGVLAHCRDPDAAHVRGCWVVDLVLGKG
jgi:hypothetical protein